MNRQQKQNTLEGLRAMFEANHFYIFDCNGLNANQMYQLRYTAHQAAVTCKVVPNALLQILFKDKAHQSLTQVLTQNSTVFFAKQHPIAPAKIIQAFKTKTQTDQPIFKGAWVYESSFIGIAQFDTVLQLKSKEELLGDLTGWLQSPFQQLIQLLQSSGHRLSGTLQKMEQKPA